MGSPTNGPEWPLPMPPKRWAQWLELYSEYVLPSSDEIIALAGRLKNLREVRNDNLNPDTDILIKDAYIEAANNFEQEILQKARDLDTNYLERLAKATTIVRSGRVISKGLDATGSAVMAYHEVYEERKSPPIPIHVREKFDLWRKEGGLGRLSDSQWARVERRLRKLFS